MVKWCPSTELLHICNTIEVFEHHDDVLEFGTKKTLFSEIDCKNLYGD